jgi:hypothetical protein
MKEARWTPKIKIESLQFARAAADDPANGD